MVEKSFSTHCAEYYEFGPSGDPVPYVRNTQGVLVPVGWCPQAGSQEIFLKCPEPEVLLEGTRAGGKTEVAIVDFLKNVGRWGSNYNGCVVRQSHPQLREPIKTARRLIAKLMPDATFNAMGSYFQFATGERLDFRHLTDKQQFDEDWIGQSYQWILAEELCSWADPSAYLALFSCLRTTIPGIPLHMRATTNPSGVGQLWVQTRFRLPTPPGVILGPVITDGENDGRPELPRRSVHSHFRENKILMAVQPNYVSNLLQSAASPSEERSWLFGDWTAPSGAILSDIWHEAQNHCVIWKTVSQWPPSWRWSAGYDHGSTAPHALLIFAESDGTTLQFDDGTWMPTCKGDIFLVHEWNGCVKDKPAIGLQQTIPEISYGIMRRLWDWGLIDHNGKNCKIKFWVADSSIFADNNGFCVSELFKEKVRINGCWFPGIHWEKASGEAKARIPGWDMLRTLCKNAIPPKNNIRERRALFIMGHNCPWWLKLVPTLPRDPERPDDVDEKCPTDHLGDATRYRLRSDAGPSFRNDRRGN